MWRVKNEGLNKVDWGKSGKGRKEASFPPSIGHQALDLPSPSFSFSLKGGLGCLGGFFFSFGK
jgi:hypothetical protein